MQCEPAPADSGLVGLSVELAVSTELGRIDVFVGIPLRPDERGKLHRLSSQSYPAQYDEPGPPGFDSSPSRDIGEPGDIAAVAASQRAHSTTGRSIPVDLRSELCRCTTRRRPTSRHTITR